MSAPAAFSIIGENIHATRVVLRSGPHVAAMGGEEWISFTDVDGQPRRLLVPDWCRATDDHASGRLKHIAVAVRTAMEGGRGADDALAYLRVLTRRQDDAGAAFIDLNVDELSPNLAEQKIAMRWLVEEVQGWTQLPLAIDSSHPDVLAQGLAACREGSRPMLNSASLERMAVLELAVTASGSVVVSASGASGMPQDTGERVSNASAMVEAALSSGIAPGDVYIDPLIFPISVDGTFGRQALDAIRALRALHGPAVHITGGMSNVSFGIPGRRLINDAFLRMAIDAGADSGIIDPVTTDLARVRTLELTADVYALARDAILGIDTNCRAFLRAYRAGAFADYGVAPPPRRVA